MSRLPIVQRLLAVAAASAVVFGLSACGGSSVASSGGTDSGAAPTSTYWDSPSPAVSAGELIEGQFSDPFDAWQFKLRKPDGTLPEFSWTVKKLATALWLATGKITGADGRQRTGHWQIWLPLDRDPTAKEIERADRKNVVVPLDAPAWELSTCPPGIHCLPSQPNG